MELDQSGNLSPGPLQSTVDSARRPIVSLSPPNISERSPVASLINPASNLAGRPQLVIPRRVLVLMNPRLRGRGLPIGSTGPNVPARPVRTPSFLCDPLLIAISFGPLPAEHLSRPRQTRPPPNHPRLPRKQGVRTQPSGITDSETTPIARCPCDQSLLRSVASFFFFLVSEAFLVAPGFACLVGPSLELLAPHNAKGQLARLFEIAFAPGAQ